MFTSTQAPSIPEQVHTKIALSFRSSKDTTALINQSTSTITRIPSTRVSSTIMTGNSIFNTAQNNKNAMYTSDHEAIPIRNRVPINQ
ncbi:unnamed protein product [Rhizopus stolonifer]